MAPIRCSNPSSMTKNSDNSIVLRTHPSMSQLPLPRRDLRRNYPGISPSRQAATITYTEVNTTTRGSLSLSETIPVDMEQNAPVRHYGQEPQYSRDGVTKSPSARLNTTDTTVESLLSHSSMNASPHSTSPTFYSYKGPFESDAARQRGMYPMANIAAPGTYHYHSPYDYRHHLRQNIPHEKTNDNNVDHDETPPIVFRDPLDESVMSSMSQQELIRKKVRADTTSKRRNYNLNQRKKKKPIVQLPAGLLLSAATTTRPQNPASTAAPHNRRIPHYPKSHYYVPTDNSDSKKQEHSKRSRWNVVKAFSKSYEEELESSTAESTKESDPQHVQQQQQYQQQRSLAVRSSKTAPEEAAADPAHFVHIVDSFPQKQEQPTATSSFHQESSRKKKLPNLAISGDDAWLMEETRSIGAESIGEESFPILSKNGSHEIAERNRQQQRANAQTADAITDAVSHTSSSTNSSSRRGVRFAGTIATTHCCDEDSSQVPWDEKASIGNKKDSSPTSVIVGARAIAQNNKPKSILRTPRFKPIPGIRYYDQRMWHISRQGLTPSANAELSDRSMTSVSRESDMEAEPRVVLDYYFAEESVDNKHLHGDKSEAISEVISTDTKVNRSTEMTPPRKGKGFLNDDTSLQISPILPASTYGTLPSTVQSISEPISHLVGHPAEKHLINTMATIRQMHGGEIANQVIKDEEYPDPPLDINIGDDDTVASAYAFIETVAAIVIQTAVRRHLATWHVRALRDRLSAEKDRAEQQSAILRGKKASNSPHEKQRLVIKVPSRVSDLLSQTKSPGRQPQQRDIVEDLEKERIASEKENNDGKKETSKLPREISTTSKVLQGKDEDTPHYSTSSKTKSNVFDVYGETNDCNTTSQKYPVPSKVSLPRGEDTPEVSCIKTSEKTDDETSPQKSFSAFYELAAVLIQSMWRGFWVRDMLDVDIYCATLIQKSCRGFLCRSRYHEDMGRIVLVQSWWRRNIARDQAAITLAHAIIIQSVYRCHRIRKLVREYRATEAREKQRKLAMQFQSGFRQQKARQISKEGRADKAHELKRVEMAATVIQTRWRTFVSEAKFIRDLVDILIVQAIVRRWLACHRVARIRQRRQAIKNSVLLDNRQKKVQKMNIGSSEPQAPDNPNPPKDLPTKEQQDHGVQDIAFSKSQAKSRTREAIDPGASDFRRVQAVSDPPEIVNQVIVSSSVYSLDRNVTDDSEELEKAKSPETQETITNNDLQMVESSPSDEISMPLSQVQPQSTTPSLCKAKSPPPNYPRSKVAAFTAIYERDKEAELLEAGERQEIPLSKAPTEDPSFKPVLGTPPRYQAKSRQIVAYPESYTGKAKTNTNYSPQKMSDTLNHEPSYDQHDKTQDKQCMSCNEEQVEQHSDHCVVTASSKDVYSTILAHSPSDEIMQAADCGADRSKRDTSPGRAALLKNGTTTSLVSMWKEKEKNNAIV